MFPRDEWKPLEDLLNEGYAYHDTEAQLIRFRNGNWGLQEDLWLRDEVQYPVCKVYPNLLVYKHMWTYYQNIDTLVRFDEIQVERR